MGKVPSSSLNVATNASSRALVSLPCLCANLSRGTRLLTQLYAEALRPLGLRATQFSIPAGPGVQRRDLARGLGELARDRQHDPDQDTASDGPARWIAERRGTDRRKRIARRDTD